MPIKEFKTLTFEYVQNYAILTLNRPDKLNALNTEVLAEIKELLKDIHHHDTGDCKGIIFTGAGEKAFVAGADIAEMAGFSVAEAEKFCQLGQHVTMLMEGLKIPIIAAVHGFALGGGCELAMACDFILATQDAVFGQPEVKLGLIPGFGGTQRLANYIGRNKARELIYTGRNMPVTEALENGLVLKVFANKNEMLAAAKKLIEQMAKNSPMAISMAKKVMNMGNDLNLGEGLACEKSHFSDLFNSQDMREGTTAFVQKRKACFTGK